MKKLLIIMLWLFTAIKIFSQQDSTLILPFPCEKMPLYKGGDKAMQKFIQVQLKYCKDERNGTNKIVGISFIVTKDKQITQSYIFRSSGTKIIDEEALRVVQLLSFIQPAMVNNNPIDLRMNLIVTFKKACTPAIRSVP
jgi:TonB family protein